MAEQGKSCSSFLTFMCGAAIGGGLAYLFAPRSGVETREKFRQTAEDVRNRMQTMVDEAEERIRGIIEEGITTYEEKRAAFRAAAEAGREAYRETKEEVTAEEAVPPGFETQTPGQA